MSTYADGYRAGLEAAEKVAEGVSAYLIRSLPVPAVDAQPEVERLREALQTAMAYMPHGQNYAGPFFLSPEEDADYEKCLAALGAQP